MLLSVRSKPGVVTHGEYVIVVGGARSDGLKQDENILNWSENTGWRRVSMTLPVPMNDISLTVSGDYIVIMNYFHQSNHTGLLSDVTIHMMAL